MRRILLLALALRVAWALLLPFNNGPDEARHTATVRFFVDSGRLATREEILSGAHGFYIALSPLPYVGHVLVGSIWKAVSGAHAPVLALRLVSVFWGVLLVALAGVVGRQAFTREPQRSTELVWLLALHPQLCFQSAYVSWDILTFLVCASVVATWPRLLRSAERTTAKDALRVGLVAGLCLLGKPTGFAVLPVLLGVFVYAQRRALGTLGKNALIAAAVCASVALPFFVHNQAVLPGDPFGFDTALHSVSADWEPSMPGGSDPPWHMLLHSRWLINTFESSWGVFGHLSVKLPNVFYLVWAVLSLTAVHSLYAQAKQWRLGTEAERALAVAAAASVAASLALSYATSALNDFQPYGRYLFPSLLPLAGLGVAGLARYRLLVACLVTCAIANAYGLMLVTRLG